MLITIIAVIALIVVVGLLFINLSPQFGGSHTEDDIARYSSSENFEEGKFINSVPTNMDMSTGDMLSTLVDFIKGVPNGSPSVPIPVIQAKAPLSESDSLTKLVWFGHSAFWLAMDGMNILIDPMLGSVPAPHPLLGRSRYSDELPIEIDELPQIDAIIISHDHYDHLDYGSIQKLMVKTKQFFVPLGVGAHLREWGIDNSIIREMDWWEEEKFMGLELAFTPSRHFSGRGLGNNFSTLWGSWVIRGTQHNLYFSGDSGYTSQFKEIGEKYGPFDFAMIECGQYNKRWADIHMMPEETAQASIDLQAKVFMPIHWAAFTLALHSWTDPVERVVKEAERLKTQIYIPKIGEEITITNDNQYNYTEWWHHKDQ